MEFPIRRTRMSRRRRIRVTDHQMGGMPFLSHIFCRAVPREKKAQPVRIGRKKKSKGVDGIVKLPPGKWRRVNLRVSF